MFGDPIDRLVAAERKRRVKAQRSPPAAFQSDAAMGATPEVGERLEVYEALFPDRLPDLLGFAVIIGTPTLAILGWLQQERAYWIGAGALVALWPLWRIGKALTDRVRFRRFVYWRQRLPFRVVGWPRLVDEVSLPWDLCWRDGGLVRLELGPDARDPAWNEALEAILAEFVSRSNAHFYRADGGDHRSVWRVLGTECRGSLNRDVVREILRLLSLRLPALARRGAYLEAVYLHADDHHYEVPIMVSSD